MSRKSRPRISLLLVVLACQTSRGFDPPAGSFTTSKAQIAVVPSDTIIAAVDSTYFGAMLPALGRLFVAEDYKTHGAVAIISAEFWTDHYGRRPQVVGSKLEVGGLARTIVGVMPKGVDQPTGVVLWTPR